MNRERSAAHAVKDEVYGVVYFIAAIWAIFLLDLLLPWDLSLRFALVPRSVDGLFGIVTMPFLHGGFRHVLSNTLPLIILLTLLAGSKVRSWEIVAVLIVVSGVLLWLFGNATGPNGQRLGHVGASGLVFGLVGYLIGSGLFERRLIPMAVAVIVGLMFGGMTLQGLIPTQGVSWGGHFFGLLAGFCVAGMMARGSSRSRDTLSAANRIDV
jgi:membrane associated rhomboid family serine protease